jgi:sugar phosphate isomerase/epimerase
MATRRSFIKQSTILSAGLLAGPAALRVQRPTIGVQLYTVRDAMAKDPVGTLGKVAAIGYNSVEGATYTGTEKYYGMTPKEFKKVLKDNGLMMLSSHYRLGEDLEKGQSVQGTILHDWKRAIDDAAEVGQKYMVCAWLSESERGTLDHYKKVADDLNTAGEQCRKAGIQLCYHNHNFEFIPEDGKLPYDILLGADKNLVKMEVDLYWTARAGQDPIKLFENHPGRFPLWHAKDMDNTAEKKFTEVGSGIIDFKEIFKYKHTAGMKYFFVEEDICPGSPFDSIKKSYDYIRKNLV